MANERLSRGVEHRGGDEMAHDCSLPMARNEKLEAAAEPIGFS